MLSGTITNEIIPYCLRLSEDIFIADLNFTNITDPKFTFAELRKENITSQQLLSWSASIDQVERYQIFLDSLTNLSSSSLESEILFYNCTSPWFGPLCRFAFDSSIQYLLHDMVVFSMEPDFKFRKFDMLQAF